MGPLKFRFLSLLLVLCAATAVAQNAVQESWPSFRGNLGLGYSDSELPLEWDGATGKNVRWKAPLPATKKGGQPDHNQSSPIITDRGKVIVTTAFWPEKQDASIIPEQHVTCYRALDGQELWDVTIPAGPWKLSDLRGGYCAPTPVTDGERVYVIFGSSVLAAVDLDGKLVWRKEIPDWQSFDVAMASSPILVGNKLLVLADRNGGKSTLTAYDPKTGDIAWEKKRPEVSFGHTTPVLFDSDGKGKQLQLLVAASNELQALNPETGDKIWWCKTPGDVTAPVFTKGLVYTDSGRGGPGILVDASGKGDVAGTHVKWKIDQIPEGLSSPSIVGDYLYRLHTPGVLKCFGMSDGKEVYAKRLDGVSTASSPITTPSGRVYFASAGKTFVVQSGPTFKLLATNDLGEPSSASAATARGILFLKGQKHLFCVGEK